MTTPPGPTRAPVASFDRIDSLTDPEVIARYRGLLESGLGTCLSDSLWERMVDAGVVDGARRLLWSKALALREGTALRRDDWDWWVARLSAWSTR